MGSVTFNGVSSETLGLIVQSPPTYEYPERDYSITHVIGRNGDVVIDNNCYKNVERSYYLASIFRQGTGFIENARALVDWLHSAKGYARLEDSYDPGVYRLAIYRDSQELTNILDAVTAVQAVFECKPQRFLILTPEQESMYTYTFNNARSGQWTISNPTKYTSLPLVVLNLTSNLIAGDKVTINIGGKSIVYNYSTNNTPREITFDCENKFCYTSAEGTLVNVNQYVEMPDGFPTLESGNNIQISFSFEPVSSGRTISGSIKIEPRWWTL